MNAEGQVTCSCGMRLYRPESLRARLERAALRRHTPMNVLERLRAFWSKRGNNE